MKMIMTTSYKVRVNSTLEIKDTKSTNETNLELVLIKTIQAPVEDGGIRFIVNDA